MTPTAIKEVLRYEMENKRTYAARYDTDCDYCGAPIQEGEPFIFLGDRQKCCNNCHGEIIEFLEE